LAADLKGFKRFQRFLNSKFEPFQKPENSNLIEDSNPEIFEIPNQGDLDSNDLNQLFSNSIRGFCFQREI
jgi:hypothetical protein